jgi:hypothetical protein
MHTHKYLFLGSLVALSLFESNPGLAQTPASVPKHILGGEAVFTPTVTIPSGQAAGGETSTQNNVAFPLPSLATHTGVSIVVKSPAFIYDGSFFFPLSASARPQKTGDFSLEGEIAYSYPADHISLLFSQFRVDTSGNVFARFTINGKEIGGKEIQLLTGAAVTTTSSPGGFNPPAFEISAKEEISVQFAAAINNVFHDTVLTSGQELATLTLVAVEAE